MDKPGIILNSDSSIVVIVGGYEKNIGRALDILRSMDKNDITIVVDEESEELLAKLRDCIGLLEHNEFDQEKSQFGSMDICLQHDDKLGTEKLLLEATKLMNCIDLLKKKEYSECDKNKKHDWIIDTKQRQRQQAKFRQDRLRQDNIRRSKKSR